MGLLLHYFLTTVMFLMVCHISVFIEIRAHHVYVNTQCNVHSEISPITFNCAHSQAKAATVSSDLICWHSKCHFRELCEFRI